MSIASLLKRLTKALPVILAAAPGVVDAVKQVQEALRKPKKAAAGAAEPEAAAPAPAEPRQLSADSGRAAR
jgi:hypothetical protein